MNIEELKEKLETAVRKYIKDEDFKVIEDAINFAIENYNGIKHYDGSEYVLHALRTALILTELHSDTITIISGLIHWLVTLNEKITTEIIKQRFGEEVYELVDNLQRINKLRLNNEDESSAAYLRKVLVGLSTDVRVIIIKLAGRLDNLRYVYTYESPTQKQKCIATQKVLIPIAHRLGINYIKSELEDLCLKYLDPKAYNEIINNLDATKEELNGYLEDMKESLLELMSEHDIKCRIKARVKSIHSLHEKLCTGRRWNDIYDILALRIIVEKESDCYLAIGLIHAKYRPIPKRFKDYIAQPKENMYQSIHTGVIGPNGNVFEIQIRTEEMDEIAECGVASHWSYKEHGAKAIQSLMEQKLILFRDSIEISDNDTDLINEFEELFVEKMVYVFTPKGDIIELPEGSTPIDFAYRIHSHIGETLVGAIVNDQIVPLDYELKNDDIVKIKTNASSTPKKEWMNIAKTNKAKACIKAYLSRRDRQIFIARGEELLNKEIRRRKWSINETLTEENIGKLVNSFSLKDFDELKVSIGSLRYTANNVLSHLEENNVDSKQVYLDKLLNHEKRQKKDAGNDITVAGCDDILVTIANCCTPVRGDEIVGFITKGNGVTVHKKDCTNIKGEETRCIDVSWSETNNSSHRARVLVKTNNINNNLLDIVVKSTQRELNIESINTINSGTDVNYELLIKVPNAETLDLFMSDLESLKFVKSVERIIK